ncbi:hypothetical protein KW489_21675 [Vibrio fluvialis]|nr:hypothetical protein [Vibrio fluvialis]MBY8269645.1 hypothetical protein [Vibrio fluvialis]
MFGKIRDFIYLHIFLGMGVYAQILVPEVLRMQIPYQILTILSIALLLYAFCSYFFCEYSPNFVSRESDVPLYICIIISVLIFYAPFISIAMLGLRSFDNPFILFVLDYFSLILIFPLYGACIGMLVFKKGKTVESRFEKEERKKQESESAASDK